MNAIAAVILLQLLVPIAVHPDPISDMQSRGLRKVKATSFTGKDLRGGTDPALVMDLNIVVLTDGYWNAKNVKDNLKKVDSIYAKCGIGLGKVTMYTASYSTKAFYELGMRCSRFQSKTKKEYHCLGGGPHDPNVGKSVQGLAQMTQSLPRPVIHYIDEYVATRGISAAFSYHTFNKKRLPWTDRVQLETPVTPDEQQQVRYYNNVLGTAYVANNLDAAVNILAPDNPTKIDDPQLSVRAAHEIGHLMGSDHHDEEHSFMSEAAGSEDDHADEKLCAALRKSPMLRSSASGPAQAPPPPNTTTH